MVRRKSASRWSTTASSVCRLRPSRASAASRVSSSCPQKGKANYKVEEQGDDLIITTAAMRAVLNEATGQITFYDLKDQVLLKEVAQGGKTFQAFHRARP